MGKGRCKFYNPDGSLIGRGCPRGPACWFVHPGQEGWDTAPPPFSRDAPRPGGDLTGSNRFPLRPSRGYREPAEAPYSQPPSNYAPSGDGWSGATPVSWGQSGTAPAEAASWGDPETNAGWGSLLGWGDTESSTKTSNPASSAWGEVVDKVPHDPVGGEKREEEREEEHEEEDTLVFSPPSGVHSRFPGMLIAPDSSPLGDAMAVDKTGDSQDPLPGPLSEWDQCLDRLYKAVFLQQELGKAKEQLHKIRNLQASERYCKLKPGHAAFDKITDLLQKQQLEVKSIQEQLDSVVGGLQDLSLPAVPSSSSDAQEQIGVLEQYASQLKSWLSQVDMSTRDQAEAETTVESPSQPLRLLQHKVAQVETRLQSLEEYLEDIKERDQQQWEEYLPNTLLTTTPNTTIAVDGEGKAVQASFTALAFLKGQLGSAQQDVYRLGRQMERNNSAISNIQDTWHLLQELQAASARIQEAHQKNGMQIKELHLMLNAASSMSASQESSVSFSQDDLMAMLLPSLKQQAREDMKGVCETMLKGVNQLLEQHQNGLASEVWARLEPVLKFTHHVHMHIDKISGGQSQRSE